MTQSFQNFPDYSNWYALNTFTGSEKKTLHKINKLSNNLFKLYLPQREVIHSKKGIEKKLTLPLFPGYFFIHDKINELIILLESHNMSDMVKPVSADNQYLKIDTREMKRVLKITNRKGIVPISRGVLNSLDQVEIIEGPLKNFSGEIIFINKRKKKAKVRVKIKSKTFDVTLGLEILSLQEETGIPRQTGALFE